MTGVLNLWLYFPAILHFLSLALVMSQLLSSLLNLNSVQQWHFMFQNRSSKRILKRFHNKENMLESGEDYCPFRSSFFFPCATSKGCRLCWEVSFLSLVPRGKVSCPRLVTDCWWPAPLPCQITACLSRNRTTLSK